MWILRCGSAALLLLLGGCDVLAGVGGNQQVPMNAQNNSGRTGTATLTQQADEVLEVTLELTGGSDTGAQPAHIREGTCEDTSGALAHVLAPVTNGNSTTAVPNTLLADVRGMSVHVYNSADATITVSCGDIR